MPELELWKPDPRWVFLAHIDLELASSFLFVPKGLQSSWRDALSLSQLQEGDRVVFGSALQGKRWNLGRRRRLLS